MNATAFLMLTLVGAFAIADWVAVGYTIKPLEYVAKPMTMALLLAAVLAIEPANGTARVIFLFAIFFSLVGDIFLMLPNDDLFIGGLASFFVAHVAYVAAFWVRGVAVPGFGVGLVVVLIAVAVLGVRIAKGAKAADPKMAQPVMAYMGVISLMVASAFGTANVFAIVGCSLFYASDALIAWNRFIQNHASGPLAIIVTYHLAQVLLALSLL